jgi:light-dependent protochlorophyllide reductase
MAATEETTPAAQPEATNEAAPAEAAPPAASSESDAAAPAAAVETATAEGAATPTAAADAQPAAADEAPAAAPAEPPTPPKVVIVTGASSGLGLEVSRLLCDAGHDVIMACRNEEKANRAMDKIKKSNPKGTLTYLHLDLASLESVKKFVDDFHATGKKLAVLVNNAGLALNFKDTKRQYTKDNFELTLGTNHVGPFVLTHLLLDDLKKTATEDGDARVVVITSSMHDQECCKKRGPVQPLDLENIFLTKDGTYTGLQAYKNSKLANILFMYELNRQVDGTGVKVNAVDPGFVPTTDLLRNAPGSHKFFTRYILHGMLRFTKQTRTISQAGNAIVAVAVGDKFKDTTGKYLRDGAEVKSSEESLDEAKQKKLWELTGGYAHLDGFEALEVPQPPPEPVKEEPKPETKAEEANGDAAKGVPDTAGDNTAVNDTNKCAETKEDGDIEKGSGDDKADEKKDEEKAKEEEKKPEENKE